MHEQPNLYLNNNIVIRMLLKHVAKQKTYTERKQNRINHAVAHARIEYIQNIPSFELNRILTVYARVHNQPMITLKKGEIDVFNILQIIEKSNAFACYVTQQERKGNGPNRYGVYDKNTMLFYPVSKGTHWLMLRHILESTYPEYNENIDTLLEINDPNDARLLQRQKIDRFILNTFELIAPDDENTFTYTPSGQSYLRKKQQQTIEQFNSFVQKQ